MKAVVDKNLCIGCGLCVEFCPQIFSIEQDGKSAAKDIVVPSEIEGSCRDAAQNCPVGAIAIVE